MEKIIGYRWKDRMMAKLWWLADQEFKDESFDEFIEPFYSSGGRVEMTVDSTIADIMRKDGILKDVTYPIYDPASILSKMQTMYPEIDGSPTKGWKVVSTESGFYAECTNGTTQYLDVEGLVCPFEGYVMTGPACIEDDERLTRWRFFFTFKK
jgi:hypothetical protein